MAHWLQQYGKENGIHRVRMAYCRSLSRVELVKQAAVLMLVRAQLDGCTTSGLKRERM